MNRFLLGEGKKTVLGKVQNALSKFDKKKNREVSKACRKTYKQEEIMKKWSLGSIIAAIGVILTIFWTYTNNTENQAKSFQKLESGLTNIDKNQDRLMKLTEKIADNQTLLRVEVAKVKTETGINSEFRKVFTTPIYKKRRR